MDFLSPKLKRYQKDFDFSYSFGIYPTLELLKEKKEYILKVVLKKDSERFEGVSEIINLCKENSIPFEYNDRVIERVAYKENTYVMGVFKKYDCRLGDNNNHLVLVEPRNMGNLGTIIRSMVGFGFRDLVIINPGADIFDPKVISSAMGAMFKIDFSYFDNINDYTNLYPKHSMYCFMLKGSKDICQVSFNKPASLILGNEMKGLPKEYESIGESVYIPHSDGIDSLNLSVAASIGMWEFKEKNDIITQE